MKVKEGYLLRELADTFVVVPTGKATLDFSGVITLNGPGAFLWKLLSEEKTEGELLKAITEEYEVEVETAKVDIVEFIEKLKAADLLV